jgi:branched-chain amino acid aminotransferase
VIRADWVWLDGRLVPFAEATTHVTAFTLHYGLGFFEGIRCYRRADGRSALFRLREHLRRFHESGTICTTSVPFSRPTLEAACLETLRANRHEEAYVRPLAFVGAGALGLGVTSNPTVIAIVTFPFDSPLGEEGKRRGIRCQISSFVRGHPDAMMSKAKLSGQYAASVLAKREAQRLGFDEAILLDAHGRVCEGTAENVFVLYRGRLYTPPLELPILDGITRDAAITLAREAGIEVVEQSFTRDMLLVAEEIFLTGTATEITPVRELDGRPVAGGQPGPVTRKIQEAFAAVVRGPAETHPEWLTWL